MNSNLAEENLRTIRLLMERSALYRRALAPIMLVAGILGVVAAGIGIGWHLDAARPFAGLWLGTACVALAAAFFLVRRQAFKAGEKIWSPPTFRVAQALLPPLLSGMLLGGMPVMVSNSSSVDFLMVLVWILFYGCALHSAGFFMLRGIKWFGWAFIFVGIMLMFAVNVVDYTVKPATANWLMGLSFGGLHLAYGIYLYFTEKQHPVA